MKLTEVIHIIAWYPKRNFPSIHLNIDIDVNLLKQHSHEAGVAEQDAGLSGGATGRVCAFVQGKESKHQLTSLIVDLSVKII